MSTNFKVELCESTLGDRRPIIPDSDGSFVDGLGEIQEIADDRICIIPNQQLNILARSGDGKELSRGPAGEPGVQVEFLLSPGDVVTIWPTQGLIPFTLITAAASESGA